VRSGGDRSGRDVENRPKGGQTADVHIAQARISKPKPHLPRTHWNFLESLRDRRQDPTVSDIVRNIINMVKEQIEQSNESSATSQAAQINRTQRPTTLM